ncbi:MAG TPA: hypothetical protein VLU25_13505 [Acidobacteriota bacterium]|nr:hypothetical protein [Acidobacteriota bacterium]
MEKIRKQRRSHFLLNLLPVESLGQAAGLQQEDAVNGSESGADAEAAADGEASDQRQIFDLGGFPSSVSFHETAHGFFALTYSQDQADKFRLRLLRLGPDEKWEQVEQASALQGLRPVLVEEGELLWLYYLQTADLISRSFSRDGIHWSPPETIGEGVAVSVDAVVLSEGTAVAWSLSTGDETRVDLARCTPQGCSEPRTIFAAEGRMGYIALASEPASGKLLLLCSYWDPKNQSQVIEASAEAQGFEKRRLTPEGKDISASSDLLVYHGRDAAFAIWHQSLGKGSQQTAGKVGLALYDYEESRWMMPPLTIGPDDATLGVADSPRLAFHGDSVWLSFIACDSRTGLFGVKTPAFTGELFLKRLDLESEEQEGQSR